MTKETFDLTEFKKYEKRLNLGRIIYIIAAITFVIFASVSATNAIVLKIISGLVALILFFTGIILTAKTNKRIVLSGILYQLYDGIKNKNIKKKYIKKLYSESEYQEKDEITKMDLLFENYFMQINTFYKNLEQISFKLNHALINKSLNKIDSGLILELAKAVWNKKNNILILSQKIVDSYHEEQKFPGLLDWIKNIFKIKIIKFLLLEIILLILFVIIYL